MQSKQLEEYGTDTLVKVDLPRFNLGIITFFILIAILTGYYLILSCLFVVSVVLFLLCRRWLKLTTKSVTFDTEFDEQIEEEMWK